MKLVLPGGSGHLGQLLAHVLVRRGDDVVVLSRTTRPLAAGRLVEWNGRTPGPWVREVDGADAVINLAGRSVNCRYDKTNLTEMFASRVDSTRVVADAIERTEQPPPVWLQMSTATIYAHRFDADNDEYTGVIGGSEPGAPGYWRMSIEIALAWEQALAEARTPATRKVAVRSAMVMSTTPGTVYPTLSRLVRLGLGGPIAGGRQYISWIHEADFVRALVFLLDRADLDGVVNIAAPQPLPHREVMRTLRATQHMRLGLPGTWRLMEIAALVHGTDAELLLKSRRVVPRRLQEAGFVFEYPDFRSAAEELAARHTRAAA